MWFFVGFFFWLVVWLVVFFLFLAPFCVPRYTFPSVTGFPWHSGVVLTSWNVFCYVPVGHFAAWLLHACLQSKQQASSRETSFFYY